MTNIVLKFSIYEMETGDLQVPFHKPKRFQDYVM